MKSIIITRQVIIQESIIKNLINSIKRMIIPDNVKVLGRWEITYCYPTMNKKIDLANEDHCGICYSTKHHNHNYVNPMTPYISKNPIRDLE